ncbi:fimbria/pilus periplasmic chaperone [Buttiauxella sp.]|uniref:fimbria/pilus periplasmic chaperone n=1 Tax=Buttiauxella sp. TaxID=1972222 RepID=UPI003C722ED1
MKKFVFAFILVLIQSSAYANITVYPMALGLDSKGEGSVRLISKTNDVQFVKTRLLKITNPGTPEEKEIEMTSGSGEGLAIMPPKFAIPGGSSKLVRFVAMNTPEKEEIYRVMFESVPSLDDASSDNTGTGIKTDVSVNLVWGILVTVPSANPEIKIALSSDNKNLINNGTQRIKIIDIGLCQHGKKESECQWKKENKNIYPDKSYDLPLTSNYEKVIVKYRNWMDKKESSIELKMN